ncbi:hypothetical protein B566_EDAN002709 [Ephemera danica]|nr:hypothetical protein B566_EDAN002709 [Ephemera danica]
MRAPLFLFLLVHVSLQVVPSLASFNWTNCGSATDVIHIKSLGIDLDPIQIPGKLHINAEVSIEKELTAPIWGSYKVRVKFSNESGEKMGCYKVSGELIASDGTNKENEPEKVEERTGNEKKHKKQDHKKEGKRKKNKKPKHEL